MRQAFAGSADVLFTAGLLTSQLLDNQLQLLILEAAISGGWTWADPEEKRTEIFPGYLGHAKEWETFVRSNSFYVFSADIADWRAKLLQKEADSGCSINQPTQQERSIARHKVVHPLLDEKGWSRYALAKEADVTHATVSDYLSGKTKKLYLETRKKIAKALGLPDIPR